MAKGLEGVRVIEVAATIAAPFAGKLMADLGATVVKVEPPQGEPLRHQGPFRDGLHHREGGGLHFALNGGKRSLILDLHTPEGQERLAGLAAQADILLHDHPAGAMAALGLDYERLAAGNPRLVMASLTPFGQSGPHRNYAAADLTLIHGGGWGWLCPTGSDRPDDPPIKPFGQHALIMAGMHGAMAAQAAYYGALTHGRGEHIDLSVQEVVASMLEQNLTKYTYEGLVTSRLGIHFFGPWGFYPCKDGRLFLVIVEEDQWDRLKELMGRPEWAEWEVFADVYLRGENMDVLNVYLSEWTAGWSVEELFHLCQRNRICVAPVFTFEQLCKEPHLRERGFLTEREHPTAGTVTMPGAPYRLKESWWRLPAPAPDLGEANGRSAELFSPRPGGTQTESPGKEALTAATNPDGGRLPLEGVRVLDLTWVWAGPFCTLQLAHLGAEVIKVESSLRPDLARRIQIYPQGMEEGLNRSGYFNQWGQGKRSVAINLQTPEGIELVKALAARSDVVIDNFATGVTGRLGLDAAALHAVNPDLIVASITGYGQTGPLRDYMGYGPAIVPLGGITSITGYGDGQPQEVGISYGDPNGGIYTAFAIVAALNARRLHGGGQVIELSLWEAICNTAIEGWVGHVMGAGHVPMGNRDPRFAPHNVYRCTGEDAWVAIAVTDDAQWQSLCRAIGQPDLAGDARYEELAGRKAHEDQIDRIVAAWCATRERWEITRHLQAAGVPAYPSQSNKDLTEDPHLVARDYFTRLPHPEVGTRIHPGIPWKLRHARNGVRSPAPCLGADTDAVLTELLGKSKEELRELREREVLV